MAFVKDASMSLPWQTSRVWTQLDYRWSTCLVANKAHTQGTYKTA